MASELGVQTIQHTNGTDALTIDSSGNVSLTQVGSGDFYREGTWTPTFGGLTTNPTVTYTVQTGKYVRIGNFVHVSFELDADSFSGGSGNLTIDGVPFSSNARAQGTVDYERFNLDGRTQSILSMLEDGSRIIPLELGDNIDASGIDMTTFTGTRKVRGAISYMTEDA
jgi:hypothetical protein